ncbi:MAG: GNAT family N-acetyltransferase [Thermomicrobiales bacterium]
MPDSPAAQPHTPRPPRDLGHGLRLRWSTPDDTERVAEFNSLAFRDRPEESPYVTLAAHTRAMMQGRISVVGPHDFVFVEDTTRGAIVASMNLMRQWWDYEGVVFPVGRPELVATDPTYRKRGLIRALFAELHAVSDARGDLAQGITGIAYFYRQFCYEYALDLDGGRLAYDATIPDLPDGQTESYTLRDATSDDLPWLMALYDQRRRQFAISAVVPEEFWRAALALGDPDYNLPWRLRALIDPAGAPAGYVRTNSRARKGRLTVWDLAFQDGVPVRPAALAALRALRTLASTQLAAPDDPPFKSLFLLLGDAHPLYSVLGESIIPGVERAYAWYVRVPDLPALVRHLAPALERRLAASSLAGYDGDLPLDFYRGGLRLTFNKGQLTNAEPWRRPAFGETEESKCHASFPSLVFLQLLFGWRSLAELRAAFPDVEIHDEVVALLDILFPKRLSWVTYLE